MVKNDSLTGFGKMLGQSVIKVLVVDLSKDWDHLKSMLGHEKLCSCTLNLQNRLVTTICLWMHSCLSRDKQPPVQGPVTICLWIYNHLPLVRQQSVPVWTTISKISPTGPLKQFYPTAGQDGNHTILLCFCTSYALTVLRIILLGLITRLQWRIRQAN